MAERIVNDVIVLDLRVRSLTLSEDSSRLLGWIERLLNGGWQKIVLNLLDVPFIDSEGLGEIVRSHRAAHEKGATLKVCVVRRVHELLVATGIDRLVEAFDSEEQALQSFLPKAV